MNKLADMLRMIGCSPELLTALCTFGVYSATDSVGKLALSLLSSDPKWAIGTVVAIPVTMLIACYKLGTDILNPQGQRKVLLEWPEYWRLKFRVVYALVICVMSLLVSMIGFYLTTNFKSPAAAMLIVGAWAVAAATTASVALARWHAREILGE